MSRPKYDEQKVFVVVQYERLPTFCYWCGLVGHGEYSCSCHTAHLATFLDGEIQGPEQGDTMDISQEPQIPNAPPAFPLTQMAFWRQVGIFQSFQNPTSILITDRDITNT